MVYDLRPSLRIRKFLKKQESRDNTMADKLIYIPEIFKIIPSVDYKKGEFEH